MPLHDSSFATGLAYWCSNARRIYVQKIPAHVDRSVEGAEREDPTQRDEPDVDQDQETDVRSMVMNTCRSLVENARRVDGIRREREPAAVRREFSGIREIVERNTTCRICMCVLQGEIAWCKTCQQLVGDVACVSRWAAENRFRCPLCRGDLTNNDGEIAQIRGLSELFGSSLELHSSSCFRTALFSTAVFGSSDVIRAASLVGSSLVPG